MVPKFLINFSPLIYLARGCQVLSYREWLYSPGQLCHSCSLTWLSMVTHSLQCPGSITVPLVFVPTELCLVTHSLSNTETYLSALTCLLWLGCHYESLLVFLILSYTAWFEPQTSYHEATLLLSLDKQGNSSSPSFLGLLKSFCYKSLSSPLGHVMGLFRPGYFTIGLLGFF